MLAGRASTWHPSQLVAWALQIHLHRKELLPPLGLLLPGWNVREDSKIPTLCGAGLCVDVNESGDDERPTSLNAGGEIDGYDDADLHYGDVTAKTRH